MIKRNPHLTKLKGNYLFPEINMRKRQFVEKNPHAHIISLGIGDTTEPIPPSIAEGLANASIQLGTRKGYSGYAPEQGSEELRKNIASQIYRGIVSPSDIFISDGAKCDIGRLQMLFGNHVSIAVQDPAYPVYVDGSLIQGVSSIVYMPCTPDNDFFPDLNKIPKTDLIYFCSPNNPTGAVATKDQLKALVDFAKSNQSIIIYDSAYACYIQDPEIPKSIFEIEGADTVAIEIGSFSKIAAFTGVRLGWTIVPEKLKYADGYSVRSDWNRLMSTIFNGASNIAQRGGIAVLDTQGMQEIQKLISFYLENASMLKAVLQHKKCRVYGGGNAPYLWVHFQNKTSWEMFQEILERTFIVTTPGSGFGPSGEHFLRFSAFAHRENIITAVNRLSNTDLA